VLANSVSGGIDEVFLRADSAGTFTPLRGMLGSTVGLVDATGNLTTSYSYDPFGNTTASGAASANQFQYTGRESEGNGLYFYRARYYSPAFGRFVNQDPLGFSGSGVNLYAYADNNPISFRDPLGLQAGDQDVTPEQALANVNAILAPLNQFYAAHPPDNLAGRKDFSWWGTFGHDLFWGWGFHTARRPKQSFSDCLRNVRQAGGVVTDIVDSVSLVSTANTLVTTPLQESVTVTRTAYNMTGGTMTMTKIVPGLSASEVAANAASQTGLIAPSTALKVGSWARGTAKFSGVATAVGLGLEGGSVGSCIFPAD